MRPGIDTVQAWGIIARGMLRGRCPNCGQRSMFRGMYALEERCPHCGVRHELADGSWLGAIAIGYGFGALFGVGLGVIEVVWHPIAGLGLHPLWTIALASLPVTALAYRPAKGLWFSLLYLYGLGGEP